MAAPPTISAPILRWFRWIVRGYLRRHFHAVRLSLTTHLETLDGPVIVIGNHSSWWDPMIAFLLGEVLFPTRPSYAPMDAQALRRYRILERLGVFPVEMNSPRGAARFLRTGESVLAHDGVLWVTPQGRFADVRERPLSFKPGVATLATRAAAAHGACHIVPLAIEYTFWDERMPECLLRVGAPLLVTPEDQPEDVQARLQALLTSEMDSLAALALARSPAPFQTLVSGASGIGGFYGLGKRLKALVLRRPYVADHTPHPVPAPSAEPVAPELPALPTRASEAR